MKVKVSVVMPIYKPDEKVLSMVRERLKKQTIKPEILENWNMPEAVSMNTGIKKAKGEIVVILAQDCVPSDEFWLEKLIKPLENPDVSVSVSDLLVPEWWWKEYPFLTRILTLKELKIWRPYMDMRACAYRKKDLEKIGFVNEDPKVIGIDSDLYLRIKKLGRIEHPGIHVMHLHALNNKKKIQMIYNYGESSGKEVRKHGPKIRAFSRRVLRALPLFGIISLLYTFPYKKYPHLFPIYVSFIPLEHVMWTYAFWKGFFFLDTESIRNLEVLQANKTK